MGADSSSSERFQWKAEYDEILDRIASTDIVDVEWRHLRNIIRSKIDKNIALFLSGAAGGESKVPAVTAPGPGGLKLPPFPPRLRNDVSATEAPKATLTKEEALEFQKIVYTQLDDFESSPPFTIQRVCELCVHPQQHYKFLGKYLRAVEKALLVTSTWDAFPVVSEDKTGAPLAGHTSGHSIAIPSTPIFSPIPFLHEDARRSSSRSPPPSPLVLPAMETAGSTATSQLAGVEGSSPQALGLVDELDDPSPGHLSEHPQPLSSTTTVSTKTLVLHGSLEERFVKAKTEAAVIPMNQERRESSNTEVQVSRTSSTLKQDDHCI